MIFIVFVIGCLLGCLTSMYVDYIYVKKVCEKNFIDFKYFKSFYRLRRQKIRHRKSNIDNKGNK